MGKYLTIALMTALCASLVAVVLLQRGNAALQAENASLTRSVAALEQQAAQSRLAADVARAAAQRERERAAEYDALREALIDGDEDADLPTWFRSYLDDLLGRLPPD